MLQNLLQRELNTTSFGVPHNRPRIYIVGILAGSEGSRFCFPRPIPMADINDFLDPRTRVPDDTDIPPIRQDTARKNAINIIAKLRGQGTDPLNGRFFADVDASKKRCHIMKDKIPCMTRGRPNGTWMLSRGRRLSTREMNPVTGH